VQGSGDSKEVAQVDELKERREREREISFVELLLQVSSFHPFWSLSPFHAQIILQLEEPSIIDSRQHERDFSSRIEGFGFCSFFFSSNFLISNFNDLLSFQQCKGQEDLILKKALSGVQRVKC